MTKFTATFIDTDTDEICGTYTFSARDWNEAVAAAWDEAEYQGAYVANVTNVATGERRVA